MAKKAKKSARGRAQDRARVASGQDYEVRYEAKKDRKSASAVKKAVKKSVTVARTTAKRFPAGHPSSRTLSLRDGVIGENWMSETGRSTPGESNASTAEPHAPSKALGSRRFSFSLSRT